jgi:hypothetical protein
VEIITRAAAAAIVAVVADVDVVAITTSLEDGVTAMIVVVLVEVVHEVVVEGVAVSHENGRLKFAFFLLAEILDVVVFERCTYFTTASRHTISLRSTTLSFSSSSPFFHDSCTHTNIMSVRCSGATWLR